MRSFDKRILYFNEEVHKYTDDLGFAYTSMTTVIGKYEEEFNTKAMAALMVKKYFNKPGHRYYHMTAAEVEASWTKINKDACDRGNERHNYLEDAIKHANGYKRTVGDIYINDRIYTIDDVLENNSFGSLTLEYFREKKVDTRYPEIYNVIAWHVERGWSIYAEVGVYNPPMGVSGLVDVLLVKDDIFRILDWKTNKDKLHFEAGYFKRNALGEFTDEWVAQPNKVMKPPLDNLQVCHGNTYTLQLSGYAYLVEQFGLRCDLLMLAHIRPKELDKYNLIANDKEDIIEFHKIDYIKDDVERMFKHHQRVYADTQSKMF